MACIPNVKPALQVLPGPYSIPPVPAPGVPTLDACCQLPTIPPPPPIPPLPPGVLGGAIPVLEAALAAVLAFIDGLPLDCPRN